MEDAEIFLYSGDDLMAAGDVILSCSFAGTSGQVPSAIGEYPMHTVGPYACADNTHLQCCRVREGITAVEDFAFAGCEKLQHLELPESLQRLGTRIFDGCKAMEELTAPAGMHQIGTLPFHSPFSLAGLRMEAHVILTLPCDTDLFARMLENCLRMSDGRYVVRSYEWLPAGSEAWKNLGLFFPRTFSEDILVLFAEYGSPSEKSLNAPGLAWRFDGQGGTVSEMEAFCSLIRRHAGFPDRESVRQDDAALKKSSGLSPQKTALLTFTDADIRREKNRQTVYLHTVENIWFRQACIPVSFKGNRYYIYRRYYLREDPGALHCRDIAVCTEDGDLVTDADMAEEIYAKYRLLVFL